MAKTKTPTAKQIEGAAEARKAYWLWYDIDYLNGIRGKGTPTESLRVQAEKLVRRNLKTLVALGRVGEWESNLDKLVRAAPRVR